MAEICELSASWIIKDMYVTSQVGTRNILTLTSSDQKKSRLCLLFDVTHLMKVFWTNFHCYLFVTIFLRLILLVTWCCELEILFTLADNLMFQSKYLKNQVGDEKAEKSLSDNFKSYFKEIKLFKILVAMSFNWSRFLLVYSWGK